MSLRHDMEEIPMQIRSTRRHREWRLAPMAAAAALAATLAAAPAQALNWQFHEINVQLDTRMSSGVMVRTENPDPTYVGIANGGNAFTVNADNGDLAFGHAGDVVYQTDKITSALTVSYHSFGVFVRGNYTYDPVLQNKDFFNKASFGPNKELSFADLARKQHDVHNHVGSDGTLLDYYAYGSFDLAGHTLSVKVGNQIVNWGESTFVLNGLNSIVPIDVDKARLPGAELSEFVRPVPQVFASLSLNDNISVEGWYQWKWRRTLIGSVGSFFPLANQDYVANGGTAANIDLGLAGENSLAGAPCFSPNDPQACQFFHSNALFPTPVPFGGIIPRSPTREPGNKAEFGGAARFLISWLNDTELDFYATRYTSRLPLFSATTATGGNIDATTARYFDEFPQDLQMYGFSFNASLPWGIGFQGEYSYKPNQPLQLNGDEVFFTALGLPSQLSPVPGGALGGQYLRGWRRKKVSQLDFGLTKLFGPASWVGWDQLLVIAEVAGDRVHNLEDSSQLRYEGPLTVLPGNPQQARLLGVPAQDPSAYPTANSWGYKIVTKATYNNVLPGITLEPGLRWDHDVDGITPLPLGNFVRNSRAITPSLGWRYLNNLTGELSYTSYFGGGANNLFRDRDFFSAYVRYSF
ncbi:MAG: DUF1302 domain-containing protein [Gammaproteobacteria bacterium]|nr:DUF1302 domain-containing protein [Gammaproteobacteria bacterium]